MLFLCFSSKDRHDIVESVLFHLSNYGISIWYDRNKILMGDDRDYKNFIEGVDGCKYAVIILSPNCISSVCANEEIDLIYERYQRGKVTVFPIFYGIKADMIPQKYSWMKKLVYKELSAGDDSRGACNHVMCKLLIDELSQYRIRSINTFFDICRPYTAHQYIAKILKAYDEIDHENRNSRITLLYAAIQYIMTHYCIDSIPAFYYKGVERIFSETKLNIHIDLRESLIVERSFLLLLNVAVFGYIIKDADN